MIAPRRNLWALALPFMALALHRALAAFVFPMPWLFLYPAVFYASVIGDFWVGVANAVISSIMVWYYFIPPVRELGPVPTKYFVSVVVFFGMSLVFAEVNRRLRLRTRENARVLQSLRATYAQLIERERRLEQHVADRKNLECELERAKDLAEVANRAKSTFLANMSHEIRTPLGLILGYADMIVAEGAEAEKAEYAKRIRRSAQNLLDLINDILDIAKVESGKFRVEKRRFAPAPFFADILDELQVAADRKHLRLEFRIRGELPETIETDPGRLRQILLNIVGNAIKFTDEGGVQIIARAFSNGLRCMLQIRVEDSGIGIAEDQREKLFQPFTQVKGSAARAHAGTGLGLSLALKLARALGGDCRLLSSKAKRGSVFMVTIDAGKAPSRFSTLSEVRGVSQSNGVASVKSLKGLHVLLVDDSEDNRVMFQTMLTRQGAEVELAEDGREGVKKALSHSYDVVLMDVQMPHVNGYQAVGNLREHGYTRPIVALTAEAMKGEAERCLAAGFSNYLAKPVTSEDLSYTVYRCAHPEEGAASRLS